MSDALTPEEKERREQMRHWGAGSLLAEIDRLRVENERLEKDNGFAQRIMAAIQKYANGDKSALGGMGVPWVDELIAALADRDRQLAELREACQPFADKNLIEGDDCVHGDDPVWLSRMLKLAALLPDPTAKEADRAAK